MKRLGIIVLCAAAILSATCSNPGFKDSLAGTWEWTGDKCGREGNCAKEIITNEQNTEAFSMGGLYLSKNRRINYTLKGNSIYFAPDNRSYDEFYAEIITIKNRVMLLKFNDGIKRYNKVKF